MEGLLLTRDEFRRAVFDRDGGRCVICGHPAADAHHIMERRLFPDGGYYLANGASLCADCHVLAEQTELDCDTLRRAAGITTMVLPPHLYDEAYDKWGNPVLPDGRRSPGELFYDESVQKVMSAGHKLSRFVPYVKFPRTLHLPWSLGRTKDDRVLEDTRHFEGHQVIVTEKLDGENTSVYWDGYVHARSIDGRSHPSRSWVKGLAARLAYELPQGWRLVLENVFATHTIHYAGLGTYAYLIGIYDHNNWCLSWDNTVEWAKLLDLETVPVLGEFLWNEDVAMMYYTGESRLGGIQEGYVVRVSESFPYGWHRRSVAKFVRENHVAEGVHNWQHQQIVPNELALPLDNG